MRKDKVQTSIIFFIIPILVIIGKLARYTIMRSVLVDAGIGHNWINILNYNLSNSEILKLSIAGEQNGTAILFYKFFNVFHLSTYLQHEVFISLIFNFFISMMFFKFKNKISLYQATFLMLSIVVLNLFDFCLSKEPIQMMFFIIMYFILLSNNIKYKSFISILIILISAIFFRSYFILIIVFYFELVFIFKKIFFNKEQLNKKNVFFSIVLISATYVIMILFCQKLSPSTYTELIRVRTRTSIAFSDIRNLFDISNNYLLIGINYLLTVVRILFPIELLRGGVKYALYVLYQLMVTYTLIKGLVNINKMQKSEKISCFILWAFVFTSATFEPDFGSWIRHEAVLFPLLMISSNIIKEKYKNDVHIKCKE